jgi:dihydrodipicolinate synthase/N-acetylneuraminate lyase
MKLHGIIPPLITPLRGRDELDITGLERLVEHILGGGVSGLFILGTTGEGTGLSYRLRREMIGRVCGQVNGRVPVLVSVTDTSFVESIELARYAALKGASAVVVAPPYYLPEAQPELQEYLYHLLPELPLPLFLYNIPALTKVQFDMETLKRALDDPRIVGFKDSSGDLAYFKNVAEVARQRPDWSLLAGPEETLLESLQLGGHGGVNGGANIFPALYVKFYDAFQAGDIARAQELQKQILRVGDSLYRIGKYSSSIIKGIKCALACCEICDDFMTEPFHRFRAEEREIVKSRLMQLKAELSKQNL